MADLKIRTEIVVPDEPVDSEQHSFRIEVFADNLDPLPFSIAPLPDGEFLLTEKTRGLSIISADGRQSPLIEGTPEAHNDGVLVGGLVVGVGWLLDVAVHPNYRENGWVYLHYGDRRRKSLLPISMNRLERARIRDGRWVDVESIWRADASTGPIASMGGSVTV